MGTVEPKSSRPGMDERIYPVSDSRTQGGDDLILSFFRAHLFSIALYKFLGYAKTFDCIVHF